MRALVSVLGTITALAAAPAVHAAEAVNPWQTPSRSLAVAESIAPPLAVAWRHEHVGVMHDLFAAADGRVFLTATPEQVSSDEFHPTTVEALDARTGEPLWSREIGRGVGGAYGDGLVIVTTQEGTAALVIALDAATGAERWRRRPLGPRRHRHPARGRRARPRRGRRSARDAEPRRRRGALGPPGGLRPLPARRRCRRGRGLRRRRRAADRLRRRKRRAAVLRRGQHLSLPARTWSGTDGAHVYGYTHDGDRLHINSPTTRAREHLLSAARQPAVGRNRLWHPQSNSVASFESLAWRGDRPIAVSQIPPGPQWDSPLLAGDVLYARTANTHCLYAFDARTGAALWRSDPLGRDIPGVDNPPLLGDGLLYVPHRDGVIALRSSPGAPPGACPQPDVVHAPDYDAGEPFPPLGGAPPPAPRPQPPRAERPKLTALRLRGGRVRAVVKPIAPGTRTRFAFRCGRRVLLRRSVRAGAGGAARVTVRPGRCARRLRVIARTSGLVGRVSLRPR